jgi:hypothetical protein
MAIGSATTRASGMKSARVNFGLRPNSESTSANPEIDVICVSKVIRNSGTELEEVWNVTRP